MSSADEERDHTARVRARVRGAFERWEKAHEASYDVEALAEAALSNPHAFIVRMYEEAVDDAIVLAASPGPGLIGVLTGEEQPASSEARWALLERDAIYRRWGGRLAVVVHEMEEADRWDAARAVRREWQAGFAAISPANRVFEGLPGDALRGEVQKVRRNLRSGQPLGPAKQKRRAERTLELATELMRSALHGTKDAKEACELVSKQLKEREAAGEDINGWAPSTVRARVSISRLKAQL